ncbi:MAG TPA: PLP-dependent aminotransferase family protein, partial [Prosthecobacter sp.]|nr:PLP-dependent aminotransferase family protein [Prosthecobacter sp.]
MRKTLPETPLYREVADKVAQLIHRGVLRPGEKLPSLRRLGEQHDVSLTTAIQAYIQLEDMGLVEARPRSGFFVRAQRPVLAEPKASKPPRAVSPVTVGALQSRLFEAVMLPDVVPLGGAVPGAEMLPMIKLNRSLAAQSRVAGRRGVSYDMPPGCEALRRQIAKRTLDAGVTLLPDEIITTCGATEALMLCLRAVAPPGSVVAVESPTYFGILHALEELSLKVIEVPTHPRDGMDLDALERIVSTRSIAACLAVPTFSNPLGSLMPDSNKRRLVQILSGHDIPLIEDDIFGELHFDHERPRAAKAFDQKGLVMLCSSFSKSLAPGYRVGWVAPGRFYERVKALKLISTLATPSLPALAIADFLGHGGYDHYLRSARAAYAGNVQRMSDAIATAFPSGT